MTKKIRFLRPSKLNGRSLRIVDQSQNSSDINLRARETPAFDGISLALRRSGASGAQLGSPRRRRW